MIHCEHVEHGCGAKVVHVDHARITDTEVFILTQHVTTLVLVLKYVLVTVDGHNGPMRLVIDLLVMIIVLIMIFRDSPGSGSNIVDQGTEPETNVCCRNIRPFVAHEH